ncbi:MAG: type III-B CRISPR module RAMP protein Cmr6 [Anaeromicrobium sp.]|uniref:type III-B CRISPR module RAMP protein Cmr6 n=1 Tax=Anaeromicrobium sp. TaxID=1929132 RepID=UPI0026015D78|nr:type III-B CRISPR module RAMP protein Cmr6 [Anaeromicrobium sp.]MCT4594741.1 type III-B CRISPR module RAMP protein Cmr6 [Anaeromicrobium sp.]
MAYNLGYLFNKEIYKDIKKSENKYELPNIKGTLKGILNYELEKIEEIKIGINSFNLKVKYPGLLIGTGYAHGITINEDFKIGLFFDHTTGLPIIPGSSIKGLIRHVFKNANSEYHLKEEYKKYLADKIKTINKDIHVTDKYLKNLEMEIFCGILNHNIEEEKRLSIYKRDVFFDAVIIDGDNDKKIVDEDYITPHTEGITKNPKPLKFLKVRSGVKFSFHFQLNDSQVKDDKGNKLNAEHKKDLFKKIILDFGLGAKTNVGYGVLE